MISSSSPLTILTNWLMINSLDLEIMNHQLDTRVAIPNHSIDIDAQCSWRKNKHEA